MAEVKTKPTGASLSSYLKGLDADRRREAETLVAVFTKVTKEPARVWGSGLIGFGTYHYKYASGREGDWPLAGFAFRKANLTVYLMDGVQAHADLLAKLGRHSTAKSCVYIRKLGDVSLPVLEKLIARSVKAIRSRDWS